MEKTKTVPVSSHSEIFENVAHIMFSVLLARKGFYRLEFSDENWEGFSFNGDGNHRLCHVPRAIIHAVIIMHYVNREWRTDRDSCRPNLSGMHIETMRLYTETHQERNGPPGDRAIPPGARVSRRRFA